MAKQILWWVNHFNGNPAPKALLPSKRARMLSRIRKLRSDILGLRIVYTKAQSQLVPQVDGLAIVRSGPELAILRTNKV